MYFQIIFIARDMMLVESKVWSGEYNIYCGASNSERTCKNTVLNCGEGDDCLIKTSRSGHDAYQYSTVNAKTSASFLSYTAQASGQRDCKSITVWCPQKVVQLECISCPSLLLLNAFEC